MTWRPEFVLYASDLYENRLGADPLLLRDFKEFVSPFIPEQQR